MNFETLFTLTPVVLGAVPVVVGLVQAIKGLGMDSKFAPFVSIALGIGSVALTAVAWQVAIAQGVLVGLAASGLYAGAKKVKEDIIEA